MAPYERGEEITCPECLDLLHDPVSLACRHNACWFCVTHRLEQGSSEIFCRVCETSQPLPKADSLHKHRNKNLKTIVGFVLTADTKSEAVMCESCHSTRAQVLCRDCAACLCRACSNQRHQKGEHLGHQVLVPVHWGLDMCENNGPAFKSHTPTFCAKPGHDDRPLLHYCKKERLPACERCKELYHPDHEVVPFRGEVDRQLAHTEKRIEDLREFYQKLSEAIDTLDASERQLTESQRKVEEQIASLFKVVRHKLDTLQEHYHNRMEEMGNPKRIEIAKQKRSLLQELSDVNQAVLRGEETVKQGFCWSLYLMEIADMMRDRKATAVHWPQHPEHFSFSLATIPKIEFTPPTFDILLGIPPTLAD
eukprot:TRINITY_DN29435_c0_g1_i2.p1 TRINITY_DN29435_c0_g1~~TRINITY_DN29435_c0_g1_i2.p1  ORF type:complete len:374 (-),score=64.62 TRINITY_DN29435_c0_g1_i2:178-1272(-)